MSTKTKALAHLRKPVDLTQISQEQARILIAQDVIAALDAKKIIATRGSYFQVENINLDDRKGPMRERIPTMGSCNVCALGGLFVAKVARFNDFECADRYGSEQDILRRQLNTHFSTIQLGLIEAAFEGDSSFADESDIYEAIDAADFGCKYVMDVDRMRAIMRNIVRNNGTFVPKSARK